jgi:serine/threonine protein phosphatase 1
VRSIAAVTPDARPETPDAAPGGRCLAIGDIHGCFDALTTLEAFVPFEPDDCLVTLGDYTSRGPDSRKVLDWLIARMALPKTERAALPEAENRQFAHATPTAPGPGPCPGLVALWGNHEIMMLQARDQEDCRRDWLSYGGNATLASYSPVAGEGRPGATGDGRPSGPAHEVGGSPVSSTDNVPDAHWRFLEEELRGWYETPTHFFVHANYYPDLPLCEQPDLMLFWEKFDDPRPHESGKIMVCGHTPQKSGIPLNIGHAVCIDTWVYGKGWLTCLDVGSGKYWQANQRRETRSGWLADAV